MQELTKLIFIRRIGSALELGVGGVVAGGLCQRAISALIHV